MAIHDDNWTKEMPTMYTYSKSDRIWAGGMAAYIVLWVAMLMWQPLYEALKVPLGIIFGGALAWALYYFLRIAIRGR